MKVGIITKHAIKNYGSFMQAYGLQRTIERMGHEVEIIDYTYPNEFHATHPSIKSQILHLANSVLKLLLPGCPGVKFNRRYAACHRKYYHLSKRYPTRESILNDPPIYDCYVAGSDQLWRPEFTRGDSVFFADFAPKGKKRISYASSFGCVDIAEEFRDPYRDYLNRLEHIAVREQSAVDLVKRLSGRDSVQVVDPSILLTGDEWRSMATPYPTRKKYVVCYGSKRMDLMRQLAHRFADPKGYEVIEIGGKMYDYFKRSERHVLDVGPLEWLSLMDGAEAAFIGGSFHGTVFSTLFHTPFISFLTGNNDHDTRATNLMTNTGLLKLGIMAEEATSLDVDGIFSAIDWRSVDQKVESLRSFSMDYLKEALQ